MTNPDRTFKFTAALLASIGSAGVGARANAQTCACLPSTKVANVAKSAFGYVATATYEASLDTAQDSIYGFTSPTAPSIYVDYTAYGTSSLTMTGSLCRSSYTGVSYGCTSPTTHITSSPGGQEINISPTGEFGISNSVWDHYWVHMVYSGSGFSTWIGGGVVGPRADW
jgi:hypothetical protein